MSIIFPEKFWKFLLAFLFSGALLFGTNHQAEASSITYNDSFSFDYSTDLPAPYHFDYIVQITYSAKITDAAGKEYVDGDSVPVGSRIYLTPKPLEDTDIVWFATGHQTDSPYGHWIADARYPGTCTANDDNGMFRTPLSVKPSAETVSHNMSEPQTISCDPPGPSGQSCLVTGPGTIRIAFDYSSTKMKLYVRTIDSCAEVGSVPAAGQGKMDVMAETIYYELNAVNCQAPSAPAVSPQTGCTTKPITFSATSTDADTGSGNTIQYGFDWLNNGIYSEWTGLVPSGQSQSLNYTWPDPGSYLVNVIARDDLGCVSPETASSVILTDCSKQFSCSLIPFDCSGKCGTSGTGTAICINGLGSVVNMSKCTDAGISCTADTTTCPACGSQPGWKEVAP